MACSEPKKLFGMDRYEVEDAARTLRKARELERAKPKLYVAAIKQLNREQNAIADVLQAARKSKRTI